MSYFEDIEELLSGFSSRERNELVSRFDLDLGKPEQIMSADVIAKSDFRKRIRLMEEKAMRRLHPERRYPDPGGEECSLCKITENEVSKMAKHDCGFNVCSQCIDLCAEVLRERD